MLEYGGVNLQVGYAPIRVRGCSRIIYPIKSAHGFNKQPLILFMFKARGEILDLKQSAQHRDR